MVSSRPRACVGLRFPLRLFEENPFSCDRPRGFPSKRKTGFFYGKNDPGGRIEGPLLGIGIDKEPNRPPFSLFFHGLVDVAREDELYFVVSVCDLDVQKALEILDVVPRFVWQGRLHQGVYFFAGDESQVAGWRRSV